VLNVLIVFDVTIDVGEAGGACTSTVPSTWMPVKTPADEKFVIVLDDTVAGAAPVKPASRMPVMAPPDPPTQLLHTLLWIVLGAFSWLFTQKALVLPVTVTFEKLLLLCVTVAVAALPKWC
jgi:hypothetical protein